MPTPWDRKIVIVHTLYNELTNTTRMIVHMTVGGALMNESVDKAYELIETMTMNHHQ
jgi:hypothetical protein